MKTASNPRLIRRQQVRTRKNSILQFHLSTAIVLMIVAGAFVGANVPHDALLPKSGLLYVRQGWPFCFFADWHREDPERQQKILSDWFGEHPHEPAATLLREVQEQRVEHGLRYDIIIGLTLLALTAIAAETFMRFLDGKKPCGEEKPK